MRRGVPPRACRCRPLYFARTPSIEASPARERFGWFGRHAIPWRMPRFLGGRSETRETRRARHAIAGVIAVAVACATNARADDGPVAKPQSVAVDLKRLGVELDLYAAEAHRKRLAAALTGLVVGSALVPAGFILLERTDGVSRALVIGMIIGGSADIVSVPLIFIRTRMDEIRDAFMRRQTSLDSETTVRVLQNEWRRAAAASQRKRNLLGTTMLVTGGVLLATGVTLLLAPEGVLGMSRQTQYTWGGVLMGVGVPVGTIGVGFLLEWSPEETSWEAYRTMTFDARSPARPRWPSIAAVPTAGGAMAFATMQF